MKEIMYTREELAEKDALVQNAREVLKSEFVGIDEIIDDIVDNVRTWYLFPELQERPLVVNLWGMTGVGKTSLIKRLAELLDEEKDMVQFNFAEIGEKSAWDIENDLEEQLSNETPNRIFVYDEFQYAATLTKLGEEKDNKAGLKPFWELLDSGRIHKRMQYYVIKDVMKLLNHIVRIHGHHEMKIENGVWVNQSECISDMSEEEREFLNGYFNIVNCNATMPDRPTITEIHAQCDNIGTGDTYERRFFITDYMLGRILDIYCKVEYVEATREEVYMKMKDMDIDGIIDFLYDICSKIKKGYDLCFDKSIIFVIGNLDEAYDMSFSADPDMSPDQFYRATKKISIVTIKEALQKRFRNEQIARLGNIHLIYPSFSSDSFRKIIKMSLDRYANDIAKRFGFRVEYDKTVHNIIYRESVFPTHGTRPIFSTIHEIIKSKMPSVIKDIYDMNLNACTIRYSFKGKNTIIYTLDEEGNVLKEYKFKEKLRLDSLRNSDGDERQALTAVHESGHFVMYAKLKGTMPEKVQSKTASEDAAGFMMFTDDEYEKLNSYSKLIENIKIMLGGHVAEEIIFGKEHVTNGAMSDLKRATVTASRMIREWNMCMNGEINGVYSYVNNQPSITEGGNVFYDEKYEEKVNRQIHLIIDECMADVRKTLEDGDWKRMLCESAQYLAKNSIMSRKKMDEIYSRVPDCKKIGQIGNTYYRDIVTGLLS